jgi:hypothetical protein
MASREFVTPLGVLSYPHLDRPKKIDPNQSAKYSCSLILDPAKVGTLRDVILEMAKAEFGPNALDMLKTQALASPIRSGDEPQKQGDPVYAGKFFINCYRDESSGPPQILKWVGVGQRPTPLLDKAELYAGCLVQLNLGIFSYKKSMKRGIGVALNGVLLVAPGTRIGGASRDSTDAFMQGIDADAAAAAAANAAAAEAAAAEGNASSGAGASANPW